MTDWVVQSVIFMSKTTQKQPEIEQYYPNTTLKLLPNPPKNKSSKWGTRDYPNTTLTLYKALNGGVDIKTSFLQNWVW